MQVMENFNFKNRVGSKNFPTSFFFFLLEEYDDMG